MLRSLVGSEMCIRDRYIAIDIPVGIGENEGGFFPHRVRPVIGDGGMVEDCLLYTSDAADDLLCVDLGGRRIIKKKKKTLYTHQPYTLS